LARNFWRRTFREDDEKKAKPIFNLPPLETNPQLGNTAGSNGNDQVEDSDEKSSDSEGNGESESDTNLPDEQKTFSASYFT